MRIDRGGATRGGRRRWRAPVRRFPLAALLAVACGGVLAAGQDQDQDRDAGLSLEVEPAELTLEVGGTVQLSTTVRDAAGAVVDDARVMYYSRARRSVGVTRDGRVEAYRPGEFTLIVLVPADPEDTGRLPRARVRAEVPVTVPLPPIASVAFAGVPAKFYAGTAPRLEVAVTDAVGTDRADLAVAFTTSDPDVATMDRFGVLALHRAGTVDVTATVESASDTLSIEVEENPVTSLELQASTDAARTGDVIRFTAVAKDARGLSVRGVPVRFAAGGTTAPGIIAAGAPAQIAADGRFVAERSGTYTVIATSGSHVATRTVSIEPRDVQRDIEVVGRGKVLDRRSSDLWVWEGPTVATTRSPARGAPMGTRTSGTSPIRPTSRRCRRCRWTPGPSTTSRSPRTGRWRSSAARAPPTGGTVSSCSAPAIRGKACRYCPSSPTSSPAGFTTSSSPRITSSP